MNKLYLWGIIITIIMFGATAYTLVLTGGGNKSLTDILSGDIVNALAITGAVTLVIITVFVVIKYVRQMQVDSVTGELVDENWDGIGEYKNELPTGWAVMFLLLMVWGMWYFTVGYPVNSYSQIGEYNEDTAVHNAKFEAQYKDITGNRLVEMGESVFLAECKVCHGISADGIDGKAANLNIRISTASVKYIIENGSNNQLLGFEMPMPDRNGLMNANSGYTPITDTEIDAVSRFVASGMTGEGADVFEGTCALCHGSDGMGIDGMGPNIKKFDIALVTNVLNYGKKANIGAMPKFERLNAKQKEAVGAYITSISE